MKQRTILLSIAAIAVVLGGFWLMKSGHSRDKPLVSVKAPILSAEAQVGKGLFDQNCATCHGNNAAGSNRGPPLIHIIYEPNHHANISFQRAAKYGVRAHHWRFGNMPPIPAVGRPDVTKILAYVRELQRANGIQ